MSRDTASPSTALLRHMASSVAADIAHAPLLNTQYETLRTLNLDFVALESTLTATADAIASARAHAPVVEQDATRWHPLAAEAAALRAAVGNAIERVSGPPTRDVAVVIEDDDVLPEMPEPRGETEKGERER